MSTLVELGKKALREEMLDAEYAAIAAEQTDEDRAVRAAMPRCGGAPLFPSGRGVSGLGPTRGRVYCIEISEAGRTSFLVVSSDKRNRNLGDCPAVRMTTKREPRTAIVPLGPADRPPHGPGL